MDTLVPGTADLSLDDALRLAVFLHRTGELSNAQTLYQRILEAVPDHPDALQFLGVLSHQRGDRDAAITLIKKSIALDPGQPDRYNNLGNVLLELDRFAEATAAYQHAIALQPEHADAYNNLGAVLRAQGQLDEASAAYLRAIELDPEHVDAHNNFGNLLSSQGRVKEAVAYYCKAITLMPHHPQSRKLLGVAYYTIGQIDAAAQVFHQWLQEEPDNPVAHHMYAACSGQDVPQRASDAYIESTFDVFAASFDAKLGKLGYRAPELVAAALERACAAPDRGLSILDAGCGTGLCGPLMAPYACRLVGVDLSLGMLQRARSRNIYDELVKAELQDYLANHADEFDAIISADTLVYFGTLDGVFEAACHALKPGGVLVFTVEEAHDVGDGYRINPHGRYSHARHYVCEMMTLAGFDVEAIDMAELRMEGGKPVSGLVVTGRKLAL
ncbi:MAG: tetratricopeptide repeat protein [Pseudomonadota bacterium]|nr:tetratricopeptide repeat protein [Pseudomonadota bacterium]